MGGRDIDFQALALRARWTKPEATDALPVIAAKDKARKDWLKVAKEDYSDRFHAEAKRTMRRMTRKQVDDE